MASGPHGEDDLHGEGRDHGGRAHDEHGERGDRGEHGEHGDGGDQDGWDGVVLDESFVRGAEVREPSARTRMLRERWKHEAPSPQPWRSDTPPAGWVGDTPRRSRRRRWFRRKGSDGGTE
ncbi:SGM_3592 family protein [Streptomyces sp. 4N509B]|uniref:SGM_3592 family protein n=1 Tax=Streptomyces sp. 4N509B TaxID=3457413 RepID=UPI003FD2C82F